VTGLTSVRQIAGAARRRARIERDVARARFARADLALFHEFEAAPAGGAHQSLRALVGELRRRGVRIAFNAIPPGTAACLFNSFNFDPARLERFAAQSPECRMVHRVGAVTTLYRGFDDGTDARVADLNRRFADATLAISHATVEMYRSLGIELVDPHVVHNPVDSTVFNPDGREPFDRSRKTRLIAVSWSDNSRKGGPVYRWLESVLDENRFELTFVGNSAEQFERATIVPPVPSRELAHLLRRHDVFLTATENDAYSNALVEALSCGLPAIYLDSGGSREAVKDAGFPFERREDIPALLDRLVDEYERRQTLITLPTLDEVVDGYLGVLGLERFSSVL
jgi:glycosyltransferase involved in cell wall biosynthesis